MKYLALATSLYIACAGQVSAQPSDAPPTTPGNLRATLYDNAGGELFWERSTDDRGEVVGYEVTINGENLGVLDALSFYDPSLLPAVAYVFTVIAIDNAGQRSSPAIITLNDTGTTIEPPANAGPDAPAELRSTVYSNTAAELFWRREPAIEALQYEIRQDGVVVDNTVGVSFFTVDLSAGRDFLFEVIAIGRDGARSNPSSITVRTDRNTEPPVTVLDPPSNLRAEVYSGTAAELFWDRAATPGLAYEIVRNGDFLGTTDGTSFFDNTLITGVVYTYEVSTISGDRRSAASTVTLQTGSVEPQPPTENDNPFSEPDPAGTTLLARRGYIAARDLAVNLVRAEYLDSFFDVEDAALALIESDNGEEITAQCPGGGTVQGSNFFPRAVVEFDDCVIEGQVLSGNFLLIRNRFPTAVGAVDQREYQFDALSVDAGESGSFVVSGTYSTSESAGRVAVCGSFSSGTDSADISSAILELDGDTFVVTSATFTQSNSLRGGPDFALDVSECFTRRTLAFEGSATVSSDSLEESVAAIEINGEKTISQNNDSIEETITVTPTLVANFNDGSMLTVTAISDDEDAVQVDLLSEGAAVSFVDNYRFETRPDELMSL